MMARFNSPHRNNFSDNNFNDSSHRFSSPHPDQSPYRFSPQQTSRDNWRGGGRPPFNHHRGGRGYNYNNQRHANPYGSQGQNMPIESYFKSSMLEDPWKKLKDQKERLLKENEGKNT